jgi:glycosyltransferase involved in cell wall biosynthesis
VLASHGERFHLVVNDWQPLWLARRASSTEISRFEMRILIVTSEFLPLLGGIGTYAREMALAAVGLGADVTVVAPGYGMETRDRSNADCPFELLRFPGGRHRALELPAKIRLVRRLVSQAQFDVVHAADWPFYIPTYLARRCHGGRNLLTLHGTEINEIADSYKHHVVKALNLFDGWAESLTNSDYTRQLLVGRLGPCNTERIRVVLLGVGRSWLEAAQPGEITRAELGIPPDKTVLVTVGRLTERKGQLTVIEAMARLPADLRGRTCYLIVGPNYDREFAEKIESARLTYGCDVRVFGELSNSKIRDIYAASDMFCLVGAPDDKGRVEGFGLVLLEAGAQRLPSIASATGGVPEVVLDGQSGLLVPPADANATAIAIAELIRDPDRRRRLGVGVLARASELSWQRCAAETYGLSAPMAPEPRRGLTLA